MRDLYTITFSFPPISNYIIQRYDKNPFRAVHLWLQQNEIPELTEQIKIQLIELLPDYFFENEKYKVGNMRNVWSINKEIENQDIFITMVKTSFKEDFYGLSN